MIRNLIGFGTGLVFGLGLVISGMSNPAKVLNFLDIFGTWDPSLAFVMGGAVIVTFIGFRLAWQRASPIFGTKFELPTRSDIDAPLLTGATVFGIGWGLGGFCPGPALTALPLATAGALAFVPALLVGLWAGRRAGASPTPNPAAIFES